MGAGGQHEGVVDEFHAGKLAAPAAEIQSLAYPPELEAALAELIGLVGQMRRSGTRRRRAAA
ncbi:hypothetical protein [Phenylobacterium kunshanense]|uniref:Uncharacterized protein n=1 Tax=Phenylobacterium kunshanense TaxID=1445034 RepID=A0A328BVL7_9CAUL|nr:hypothetical protein [Phenylobacterium kunshanense]RAK69108.1 hypothetical protein DJ019_03630 [Phenylobacterium kunshanense]